MLELQDMLRMLALHCHSNLGPTVQGLKDALKSARSVVELGTTIAAPLQ